MKDDPLVVEIKKWVDAEYESGRVTMITPQEIDGLIKRFDPGRFDK